MVSEQICHSLRFMIRIKSAPLKLSLTDVHFTLEQFLPATPTPVADPPMANVKYLIMVLNPFAPVDTDRETIRRLFGRIRLWFPELTELTLYVGMQYYAGIREAVEELQLQGGMSLYLENY